MAAPKSRLGRGLGGLISNASPAASKAEAAAKATEAAHPTPPAAPVAAPPVPAAPGFQEIAVNLVEPSPYQARREIPAEQLNELAESIRSEGLLQPIDPNRPNPNSTF